jgi:hypothetical protein
MFVEWAAEILTKNRIKENNWKVNNLYAFVSRILNGRMGRPKT